MKPSFSTVILFFNKPKLTQTCLDSVLTTSPRTPGGTSGKIFLVDNGSEPNTFTNPRANSNLSIQTIQLEKNLGFSKGMNTGIRKAFADSPQTTHVVALSNDVRVPPDFYATLAQDIVELSKTDTPAIFGPRTFHWYDSTKLAYTHGVVDLARESLRHETDTCKTKLTFPEYYPAAALVWARTAFEKLGGFDEDFFCYWEDVDLSRRATELGVEQFCLTNSRVFHLGRGTTKGKGQYTAHFAEGRRKLLSRVNSHSAQEKVNL